MQQPEKIQLNELQRDATVEDVAAQIDGTVARDGESSRILTKPFVASGGKVDIPSLLVQ